MQRCPTSGIRGSQVLAYEFVSFYISASGPYLNYQWYQGESGDTSVPINRTSNYYYPDTDIVGDYQYWVRVSNAAGSVDSTTIHLTVLPNPPAIFQTQIRSESIGVGSG